VPLTHASLPHMTTREVMVVALKSKRRDITLQHYAGGSSTGSKPETVQVPRNQAPAGGCEAAWSQFGVRAGTSQDGR
jgi:hypothetical protein